MNRFVAYVPTYRPVGGVIKVFDYIVHAETMGAAELVVCCPEPVPVDGPLFERFESLRPGSGVRFVEGFSVGVGPDDLAFFSWPRHYEEIAARLDPFAPHERVVHLVQNVRHANPAWDGGYPRRLLARPMSRIATNDIVAEAVRPFVHPSALFATITLGHDTAFFAASNRSPLGSPIEVLTTTWKSSVGAEVARSMAHDERFAFTVLDEVVGWDDLRRAYATADVFLGCPIAEEGFYLPALEAMAAGAVVIVPDASGNMVYCRFDENCLQAELDDPASYRTALERVASMGTDEVSRLRGAAAATAEGFSLGHERSGFEAFVGRIETEARARERV